MAAARIVFTKAWEDDRLDAELLAIGPGQRALVVAGAGDAALALAAGGGDVVAVDLNADQLRLGALKQGAAQSLAPGRLHTWFEAGRGTGIAEEYRERVRPLLGPADTAFWDLNIRLFDRGLHRSVGLARPFIRLARVARLLRHDLSSRVESFHDPAEQRAWWRRHVRGWLFGSAAGWLVAHGPVLGALSPNRNETGRVKGGHWYQGLGRRVDDMLGRVLVRDHPWWRPLASGIPVDPGSGAAWLDAERADALGIDGQAGRVEWRQGDLLAALEAERPASLAAISVSNVPDWLDEGAEARLARAAAGALAPDGRLLVRHLVRPAGPDPYLAAGLSRDLRSDVLPAQDRTALYESVELYVPR